MAVGGINELMDAATEIGGGVVGVSKHPIQPECGENEQAGAGRDGRTPLAIPISQARTGTGKYSFALFS